MNVYKGPLKVGMILTAADNDGQYGFRRDRLLCLHPEKPGVWLYEALPCRMRQRPGSNVGEVRFIPETNIRIVLEPEVACPRCGGPTGETDLTYAGCYACREETP